ncbi:MAG: alginate lyase family protein [Verrucomicrobiales bacterium]
MMSRSLLILRSMLCLIALGGARVNGNDFVHPGISHTKSQLDFVRDKIRAKEEPWARSWKDLQQSRLSRMEWQPRPHVQVERVPYNRPDIGSSEFSNDSRAAYSHALCWALSGNESPAEKASEILHAWASTLETIENHDAKLLVGMAGHRFCDAAELLKHTWGKWPLERQKRFNQMLREVFYPIIEDFYPTANGNWDAAMIQTMLAMGVYLDDHAMFKRAQHHIQSNETNGSIPMYFKKSGQCQESGRDQAHTQMGLEFLLNSCEIAWNQGIDLYATSDDRLRKGFEYTAKYNLGFDVPYESYRSFKGRYTYRSISDDSRGRLRDMYEKAYHHYHHRRGLEMPFTEQAIQSTRPETGERSGVLWSTLMYAR